MTINPNLREAVVKAMCEAAGQPNATTVFGEPLAVVAGAAINAVADALDATGDAEFEYAADWVRETTPPNPVTGPAPRAERIGPHA